MSNNESRPQISGALVGPVEGPIEGPIERNVQQPRQPTSLQGLLRFAMDATQAEDAPNDATLGPLDEERRQFLETALKSMTVDIIEVLYKNVQQLQNADQLGLESDISQYLNAFDSILEHVDMIDTAIDFHKIGGFIIFPPCLNCVHGAIRAAACDLLAELCQNNPYCQQVVSETDLMETLLNLLDKDIEEQVQVKALYAISCNVRENPASVAEFRRHDGLQVVSRALQRPNDRLRTKAAFLLTRLAGSDTKLRDALIHDGLLQTLMLLISQERMPSHEHLLALLWLLVLDNPHALDVCMRSEYGLEKVLRNYLTLSFGKPDWLDEVHHCELLLQSITMVDPEPPEMDR